jgi:FHA domain
MTQDRGAEGRNAARAPFPRRSRRRWSLAGGVVAAWLVLYLIAGSVFSATLLLVVLAAAAAIAVIFLRSMGVTRDHPWIRQLESRPWRDGQDVLRVAMNHLPDVFVVAPSGALFAPNIVEIQMNPEDIASLCDRMELGVITASASEFYEEQVARCRARLATPERAEVYVIPDKRIPRGRYRLQQGHPATAAAQREFAYAVPRYAEADADFDEWEWREPGLDLTTVDARQVANAGVDAGTATVKEEMVPPVPVLRLVTGDQVAQTRMTGAEAGRGQVELTLPNVATISRTHARFAFSDGRWWVTNLGLNGLTVNGAPAETQLPLSDGDTIRWGSRADAVVSRVEIG